MTDKTEKRKFFDNRKAVKTVLISSVVVNLLFILSCCLVFVWAMRETSDAALSEPVDITPEPTAKPTEWPTVTPTSVPPTPTPIPTATPLPYLPLDHEYLTVREIDRVRRNTTSLQWEDYRDSISGRDIFFRGSVRNVYKDNILIRDIGTGISVFLYGIPYDVALKINQGDVIEGHGRFRGLSTFLSFSVSINVDEVYGYWP